jgi:hypothetical protein
MSAIQHHHIGPETSAVERGNSTHGRWRVGYQQAVKKPEEGERLPVALEMMQDAERLVFAMTEGPAAPYLAEHLVNYLWTRESTADDWPQNLRFWLADTDQWTQAKSGRTLFICGRLERGMPGGRIYLAWLGMSGVRLLDRAHNPLTLDTYISSDEGWTPDKGPEPEGMALHAYRGSLFDLERLTAVSPGAISLNEELPDMSSVDLQQALQDWSEEADHDLSVFDLRLNPITTAPSVIHVSHRWISAEQCMLSWQPTPNTTGYQVEESANLAFDKPTILAQLSDSRQGQYTFSPPVDGQHYYRVTPLNHNIAGQPSDPVAVLPLALATPVMEPIRWSEQGGYRLRWTPVLQATGYEIQTSNTSGFEPETCQMVYRGEASETNLPFDAPLNQYYRVRAINARYAPNAPSEWSRPRRAPNRLDVPVFTHVSHKKIAWEPVNGARVYTVRVTPKGEDESQGEDFYVAEPTCGVADQAAMYRVRAMRRQDDLRTASEWSDAVTMLPPDTVVTPAARTAIGAWLLLGVIGMVALVGFALGVGGLRLFQESNATHTRTPYPQTVLDVTSTSVAFNNQNATDVIQLNNRNDAYQETIQANIYAARTLTHVPTKNATQTIEAAVYSAGTATATVWTQTPTASITPSPTETPDVNVTFAAALTATADQWTATPTATATYTPSRTPNFTATVNAIAQQIAAATSQSLPPTPNLTATISVAVDQAVADALTAMPPTPDIEATVDARIIAMLPAGCFMINPVPDLSTIHTQPNLESAQLRATLPSLSLVLSRMAGEDEVWLELLLLQPGTPLRGWILIPEGTDETTLYSGSDCRPEVHIRAVVSNP